MWISHEVRWRVFALAGEGEKKNQKRNPMPSATVHRPGRLANTVTIEKMKAGISIPRNPILLKFMQTYRYADQLGRGIPMIMRAVQKMPGFDIELKERDEQFLAVLKFPEIP